jgi:hypothetical protein
MGGRLESNPSPITITTQSAARIRAVIRARTLQVEVHAERAEAADAGALNERTPRNDLGGDEVVVAASAWA